MEKWYWISVSYATFGICEVDGIVTKTAPIAKWCRGRRIKVVLDYYRNSLKAVIVEV